MPALQVALGETSLGQREEPSTGKLPSLCEGEQEQPHWPSVPPS